VPIDFHLRIRKAGADAEARIETPISADVAALADREWVRFLEEHRQPDAGWRWSSHIRKYPHGPEHATFAVLSDDRVEGLLIVRRYQSMRATSAAFAQGSYMEYLASAPWNRTTEAGAPLVPDMDRTTPVGRVLLARAARLSMSLGHDGRLGWNSLDEALSWYLQAVPGVLRFGPGPDDEGYEYLEMEPQHARRLIDDMNFLFIDPR
jgi:hypothetical protein